MILEMMDSLVTLQNNTIFSLLIGQILYIRRETDIQDTILFIRCTLARLYKTFNRITKKNPHIYEIIIIHLGRK